MIQTLCEPDSAISTPRVPVSAPVLPLRVRDVARGYSGTDIAYPFGKCG